MGEGIVYEEIQASASMNLGKCSLVSHCGVLLLFSLNHDNNPCSQGELLWLLVVCFLVSSASEHHCP